MHVVRKNWLLILLNLFSFQYTIAQTSSILSFFFASENNGTVYLSWQIIAGSTCSGIQIHRSTDNINFIEVGDIPGICGDLTSPQDYDFTDFSPIKNSINYYRLELGNNGFSQVLSVEVIDISETGFQVRPNPAYGLSKILFENDNKALHNFAIHNTLGELVYTTSGKEDFFEFDASAFQDGTYFFTITIPGNNAKLQGKVMVID